MMGFGACGSGGHYFSQPPSNLSASAPPFTIDRSPRPGQIPLMDLLELPYSGPGNSSLNHWLPSDTNFLSNSNSELNVAPSPNSAYRYQASESPGLSMAVSASTDPHRYGQSTENGANTYQPPYLSPSSHKEGPFVSPDQARYDWSSTSQVSLPLNESSTDYSRRVSDSKYGAGLYGGLWNGFDEWKQGKHGNFDGGYSSKRTDGNVPPMYENFMSPEAYGPKCLNSCGEVLNGVNILDMENHNAETLNGKAFIKTSNFVPLDYSKSILGFIPELSETRLESASLIHGSNHVNRQLAYDATFGSTSSSSGNAPYKSSNSECDANDDLSNIRDSITKVYHSESTPRQIPAYDSSPLRILLERDDESFTNAKFELRTPSQSYDRINLERSTNESRYASEGVDHCSHVVDSPCWKGVPGSHAFPFDALELFPDIKNIEQANRVPQSTYCDREASTEKPIENGFGNLVSGELQTENDVAQNSNQNRDSVIEIAGCSEVKSVECVSSHLPNPSESLEDDSRTGFNYSNGSSLTPTIDVPGLVKTINNLSEMLMFHCERGSFQLKEDEVVSVHNAMNNLRTCVSKNGKETINDTSDCHEDLNKDFTAERPEVAKREASNRTIVNPQNFHEKNENIFSGKDGMLDSIFVKRDVDMAAEVKATQSLKAVLTENFSEEEAEPQTLLFKNLWLEAEAALCSVTYKARYNRMKIEMENSKFHKSKDAKEPLDSELPPGSNEVKTSSSKVTGIPVTKSEELSSSSTNTHDNDVIARFQILKRRMESSNSELPPESNEVETPSPKDKGSLASKTEERSSVSTNTHDADMMARFQILNCRIESLNPDLAEMTDRPSQNSAAIGAHEQVASPKPESDSSTNKHINDFDASVMARFQILKSRSENCSPISTEVQQTVEVYHSPASQEVQPPVEPYRPRFVSQRSYWPLIASQSDNPDHEIIEGPISGDGFGVPVAKDPMAQSQPSNRGENPLLAGSGWYDRVPSDWEHVRKEDLGFHNY